MIDLAHINRQWVGQGDLFEELNALNEAQRRKIKMAVDV